MYEGGELQRGMEDKVTTETARSEVEGGSGEGKERFIAQNVVPQSRVFGRSIQRGCP